MDMETFFMKDIFVRSPYNYDMDSSSLESGLECNDVSLTVQSSKDEVDINTIVRRFGLTGQLPDDVRAPTYGDFTDVCDYHSAMNAVVAANESFDRLPAAVRARFHNDPGAFVDFCSDLKNREQLKEWELLDPLVVKRELEAVEAAAAAAAVEASRIAALNAARPAVKAGDSNA